MIHNVEQILLKSINIARLYSTNPGLFKIDSLSLFDKIALVNADPAFESKISFDKVKAAGKVSLLLGLYNKTLAEKYKLTEDDLLELQPGQYAELLEHDIKTYFRKEIYNKLPESIRLNFFHHAPEFIHKQGADVPKISRSTLNYLSQAHPNYVKKYITDFSEIKTDYSFWEKMIRKNKDYGPTFLRNTKNLATKTDVRIILRAYPEILVHLTKDDVSNGKLTAKEWALLLSSLKRRKVLKNWDFPKDIYEDLRLSLSMELLNGKSANSTPLRKALETLRPVDEITEEEDQDSDGNESKK